MFQRLMVANRGEIALRVMAACRELSITPIGLYTDGEAGAAWLRLAEEAYPLEGASSAETYLNSVRILDIARRVRVDAIHPGYGFLAESAAFAEACAQSGIAFVGPPAEAMRALGSKVAAKRAAEAAGLPVMPGFDAAGLSADDVAARAEALGFPVLVKAAAGGGGRGLRIVGARAEIADAMVGARAEAEVAFGDGSLLVERFFPDARHVEIQVLGDAHGKVLHFFERECSIQRRYQKVIEEAPSPVLTETLRRQMTDAAVALARHAGYANAGTVEFLVEPGGRFYLLEVNTRLQVEHPVTEAVTGVDLVAWQIRVASGEPLALEQGDVTLRGHAIEARLYAEDPARGFLPSAGRLARYRRPRGPGIRVDDGVAEGVEVGARFDPLIAKLIAHGTEREAARRRLALALAQTIALGLPTNLAFLQAVVDHPRFAAGETTTRFLDTHMADWSHSGAPVDDDWLAAAAFEALAGGGPASAADRPGFDPWDVADRWRNAT